MRFEQGLVLTTMGAAAVLGLLAVINIGDVPLLPGDRFADRAVHKTSEDAKTVDKKRDDDTAQARIMSQQARRQIAALGQGILIELPAHELATPRSLDELFTQAPGLARKFVNDGGLMQMHSCRYEFRTWFVKNFQPETVIKDRGWSRGALHKVWRQISFAKCDHDHHN